jgi:Neocarzinostatin family
MFRFRPAIGWLGLYIALASAAALVVAAPAGAQPAPPAISLDPSTGLSAGDTVTVTGTGFSPASAIGVSMCAAAVTSGGSCDFSGARVATTDAAGSFTLEFPVVASITTPAEGLIDCAPDHCGIGAANLDVDSEVASVPLAFGAGTTTTTEEARTTRTTADEDAAEEAAASSEDDDEDDGGRNPLTLAVLAAVLVGAGYGVFWLVRRTRSTPEG